jgi:hypothetical protein
VLRDAWTPDGDTTLELHDADPTSPTTSVITSATSVDDLSGVGRPGGRRHRHYMINLRTVMYVDVYRESKSFPNSFIVFRSVFYRPSERGAFLASQTPYCSATC